MTEDLTRQLLNLVDDGVIRRNPNDGTLEIKAHNEGSYNPLDLAELTDTLPEGPLSDDRLADLKADLTKHLEKYSRI